MAKRPTILRKKRQGERTARSKIRPEEHLRKKVRGKRVFSECEGEKGEKERKRTQRRGRNSREERTLLRARD